MLFKLTQNPIPISPSSPYPLLLHPAIQTSHQILHSPSSSSLM